MGILNKILRRKEEKSVAEPIDPQVLADARLILNLLRNSPFINSMEMPVLRHKFYMHTSVQGDLANKRIEDALTFLARYSAGALLWGGNGAGVYFDRKRLTMPVLVGMG